MDRASVAGAGRDDRRSGFDRIVGDVTNQMFDRRIPAIFRFSLTFHVVIHRVVHIILPCVPKIGMAGKPSLFRADAGAGS